MLLDSYQKQNNLKKASEHPGKPWEPNKYVENQRMPSDTEEGWSKTKNNQHSQRKRRETTENQRNLENWGKMEKARK